MKLFETHGSLNVGNPSVGARLFLLGGIAALSLSAAAKPSLFLAERMYAAPGVECNVYFKNVTDAIVPDRYAWNVKCAYGKHENFRWTYVAKDADAGKEFPLVLEMWNDELGLVTAATTTVKVAKLPDDRTRPLTVALLGDSLTGCRFQDQTAARLKASGLTGVKSVGSKTGDFNHDGYGGFSWDSFLTRYAIAVDEIDNLQSEAEKEQLRKFGVKIPEGQQWRRGLLKSPLVKLVDGKKVVDVQRWLDKVNGGKAPDVIVIELGTNDVFGEGEGDRDAKRAVVLAAAKRLLKTLRGAAPGSVLAIMTIPPGADPDSFGANYGCQQSDFIFRRNVFAYNKALEELVKTSGDPKLFLVPAHAAVDTVYGSIVREEKANAHSDRKVTRCVNAVHFDRTGANQFGDALYAWLADFLGGR